MIDPAPRATLLATEVEALAPMAISLPPAVVVCAA
jgi:hypothetical protein